MPFNLILSIYPVFLMAMPVNMILVMYVILCILSYDFNKLTMLYIHVHISISMTNKSGLTFFLSIKYLSVCLCVPRRPEVKKLKNLGPIFSYNYIFKIRASLSLTLICSKI